jgi:nucleotide-binding universal stress UspA family protein
MKQTGFHRIVLATDGSDDAEAATSVAASFALASGARVRVVHVWNLEVHHRNGVWDVETRNEASNLIAQAVNRLRGLGIDADGELERADGGHVAQAIAEAGRHFNADLVVLGSRGLVAQAMVRHSTSHAVLSAVDCPVLVVRGAAGRLVLQPRRILVAVAGGTDMATAMNAALAAGSAPGSKVLVLHVPMAIFASGGLAYVESDEEIGDTVRKAMEILGDAGMEGEVKVDKQGSVARTIAQAASEWQADVIVIGSSRMGNLTSILLGSVTHQLLHDTKIPVLVAEKALA